MHNICYICRELNDETSVTLPCNHIYHKECIEQSIQYGSPECPYCRSFVTIKMIKKLYIPPMCKAVLKSGKKKGLRCCHKALKDNNGFCGKHFKIKK